MESKSDFPIHVEPTHTIGFLRENVYDRVYLDYDLDEDPEARDMDDYESGQVVADWLAANAAGRHDCLFVVHSRCKSGATAMLGTLRSAGLRAVTGEWTWRDDPLGFR